MTKVIRAATVALAAFLSCGPPAEAKYPERPIRYIIPLPGVLPYQKVIADKMSSILGQQVNVEIVAGASGMIGMRQVVTAQPDGYTIGFGGTPNMVLSFKKEAPYDPMKDLSYIGLTSKFAPQILAVRNSYKGHLNDFISDLQKDPKKFSWGSSNQNSAYVNGMRFLAHVGGAGAVYVPHQSPAAAVTDALGGHMDFVVEAGSFVGPHVGTEGKLKALAVLDNERSSFFPDIPVPKEFGVKGDLQLDAMSAIVAPKGVPPEILATLRNALYETLMDPTIQAKLRATMNEPIIVPPQKMEASVRDWLTREKKTWDEVASGSSR